jgi:hypothetical protein
LAVSIAVLEGASGLSENGVANVSQTINMAGFYVRLGRSREAIDILSTLGDRDMTPYGHMQVESIRLLAALIDERPEDVERALAYMRAHGDDAIATLQDALVRAGEVDEAAALLIRRLRDPALRKGALLEVQEYARPTWTTPFIEAWHKQEVEMLSRPDVQAVIAEVGRTEAYRIIR